ncbi:MAG TPA: nucleotidyl transferase AbiEii/AbiGii toxin family protein [Bacteriovoracaceae bacterium]|nr:nucleotidyl transferase AbiEii/AbiGii toxin family protein [Bacteriovoracaceae bacterium]
MILQRNISKIANKLFEAGGKKGRRIPESVIEKDYCLTWFLIGLSQSSLKNSLVFKGGTCLRRCYFKDYRFSEDLDFTLILKLGREEILAKIKDEIFPFVHKEVGMTFGIHKIEEDSQNTHQFYLSYIGPLAATTATKTVKVDITFNETLVTEPVSRLILKSYDEYDDFKEVYEVPVYTVDEIVTEKICALIDPKRSEPRDLYDIWHLFNEEGISRDFLPAYVVEKLKAKGVNYADRRNNLAGKEARIGKMWDQRLSQQVSNLPDFGDVFRDVQRNFRQCKISD